MSNYFGRKSEFTPAVYTRYFERTETSKTSSDHIYFNEDHEETSKHYQIKRDTIIKRLFPSRYADSNNNTNENEHINQHGTLNKPAASLGDFIPLSNNNSSTLKKKQSSTFLDTDVALSSSDDNEEDLLNEEKLPTSTHESIVGHLHPRSTIENVRTILIRELYQRTSDPHMEWLKCKMEIPKEYINPKYYADFQRRYKKEIKKNKMKKKKSTSINNTTENGDDVYDLAKNDESTASQINTTLDSDDVIETSFIKSVKSTSLSSPIIILKDSPAQPKSITEYIVLDSDDDDNSNRNDSLKQDMNSTYFIDRSSHSFNAVLQPTSKSNEDYHEEDSKYDQLPSLNTSSNSVIRPIMSKHQRRKQNNPTDPSKPLVSAIDRIIDEIDKSHSFDNSTTMEQQNILIKQIKKRKKKKKKKGNKTTIN